MMAFEDPIWSVNNVMSIRGHRDRPDFERLIEPLSIKWFNDIELVLNVLDFVQNLLIDGSAAVVYGPPNSGKTFWAINLALHVAAGIPWNERRVEQGGVIYCALEGSAGFKNRVHAWKRDHNIINKTVYFAAMESSINLLDANAHTDALISTINTAAQLIEMPVKLVVIDTLSRAMAGGNENASEDMGALVLNMDRIRAETGACVLFIHHSGKDQTKGARGHSSLHAAVDTEIEIGTTEDGAIHTATVVKQRELRNGDVYPFTLEVTKLGTNRHGESVTSCLVKHSDSDIPQDASLPRRGLSQSQKRTLEILTDLMVTDGISGHAATPPGILSVPANLWRERFYNRAMPGAETDAKQKAFRRASDLLINSHLVGMSNGRVWVVSAQKESNYAGH